MNPRLKKDQDDISHILEHTKAIAQRHFQKNEVLSPGRFVADIDHAELPSNGIGANATLELFEKKYSPLITHSAGPRYFGLVTGGSTPAAVAGDWLVSTYDQNACGSNDSIAPQVEREALSFIKSLLGIDGDYFGSFVTGATMSNFVGLALGRQWIGEQHGIDISNEGLTNLPLHVLSGTIHSSVIKSMSMLGIGRKAYYKIDVQAGREAVDVVALEKALQKLDKPVIVVANAGTVNTVDFDDLEAIARLKIKYPFWLHVDAAFGGFAGCSRQYEHLVRGINHADSICVDAHKWLNVPYDAAMQFTRHKALQLKVFQNSAAYLSDPEKSPDFFHYTPENSRRWRGLPSWFTLMAYGKEGYAEIVERNCDCARQLGEYIEKHDGFRLLSTVRMNVVCFTLNVNDLTFAQIQDFLRDLRDDGMVYLTPTMYKGTPAIRAAVSNWQTIEKDIELAFESLSRVYMQWMAKTK